MGGRRLPSFGPSFGPLLGALAALVALAFGLAARPAGASPLDPNGADWEGLSQLVHLSERELGTQRVVVRSTLPFGELKREDGLLLIHPVRSLDVDELSAFMRAGGRLVLLDDFGTGDQLLARFGIRRVGLPDRPAEMLRSNPSLAIAEPASAHPTVRDVGRVVTNHATGLEHPALSPLLVVRASGEKDVLLALAGAVGQGRLIAIGDSSVAMNAMLRFPGNRALALGLVRYLVDDDVWGKRGGRLYILVNGFDASGTFGDASRGGGALADARRSVVDVLQTLRREGLPPALAYLLALVLGLGLIGWTSLRVGRTHRPAPPRFARPLPVVAHGGIAGHAAVLGSPHASRALGLLELKSALEEELATRLGLERAPSHVELVARLRERGLLDEARAKELGLLFGDLGRVEAQFAGLGASPPGSAQGSQREDAAWQRRRADARVLATARRVRAILDAARTAPTAPRDGPRTARGDATAGGDVTAGDAVRAPDARGTVDGDP